MKTSYPSSSKSLCFTPDKMKASGEELIRIHKEVKNSLVACMKKNNPTLFLSILKDAVSDGKVFLHRFSVSGLKLEEDKSNVLHWIAKNNYKEIFQYFMENNVQFITEPSESDTNGYLPLYYALVFTPTSPTGQDKLDNDYVINNLINADKYSEATLRTDVFEDSEEWEFLDPIRLAFDNGKHEAVNLLFEQGCDIRGLPEEEQKRLVSGKKLLEFKNEDLMNYLRA